MLKVVLKLAIFCVAVCGGDGNAFTKYTTEGVMLTLPPLENIGANCRRDLEEYIEGLHTGEEWALKMSDSMEKFPTGKLLGRSTATGEFEECLSVVHPNFTGQHCTVNTIMKNSTIDRVELTNKMGIKGRNDNTFMRLAIHEFDYGICVPSTCNSSDLNTLITEMGLKEILIDEITEEDCIATPYPKLRMRDYLTLLFLLLVVLLALVSTAWDNRRKEGEENVILKSFSLRSNFKSLFLVSHKASNFASLNGLRVISMAWVILGHYFYNDYLFGQHHNSIEKTEILSKASFIIQTNAYPSVDTFFFLSGLLVCFVFFRDISTAGTYDFPAVLLRRYIRLTVPFAVVVLFHLTLFSRIISGPFSKASLRKMELSCEKYWWTYFLYIHNFYEESRRCLPPAWYLGADMQMYLISPLLTYVMLFWPKCAQVYIAFLVGMVSFVSFVISYRSDLPPYYTLDLAQGVRSLEYFYFFTRLAPWLVGLATGFFLCGLQAKKITFQPKKVWVAIGWLTSAFLCLSSLYGVAAFFPTTTEHSAFERSFYRAFHRLGWALGLSWIVVACTAGYGGFVNTILSLDIFQPLAKLSYFMYLIHHGVQKYRYFEFSRRTQIADFHAMVYTFSSDFVITLVLSIPLALVFEMPFANMTKVYLKNIQIFPYPKITEAKKVKEIDLEKGGNSK